MVLALEKRAPTSVTFFTRHNERKLSGVIENLTQIVTQANISTCYQIFVWKAFPNVITTTNYVHVLAHRGNIMNFIFL